MSISMLRKPFTGAVYADWEPCPLFKLEAVRHVEPPTHWEPGCDVLEDTKIVEITIDAPLEQKTIAGIRDLLSRDAKFTEWAEDNLLWESYGD